ncbi:granulocyte-macrophage colony-stimulating factor receptor subunit alpha-like [Rana temporaria]|uniref:granulocyte-macrophage colony-stimulating factor receptor subunit alpha-like n=1 Tax=Rana temporaria TaxID=8407 RepID=UPI001AACB9AD|nr:granulocyte-macrophage colony-stimulating factor receptor subunit alpha-like [Rana temporaria]
MKMEQPTYLLILISSWFLLELTLSEKEISFLPTNMKIHLYPGLIQITWDCNITQSMKNYEYHITLQHKSGDVFNVSACIFENIIPKHMEFEIHRGLHVEIQIHNGSDYIKIKELTAMPEGKENTGAENLSCEVYNVSIVNFSWTAGREAPNDTQYSLVIRNKNVFIPCEDYRNDSFGRQVGCVLKSPNIRFDVTNYIQLVGSSPSSEETSIRFYDRLLKLNDYVILDPPRNIRLNYSGNILEITWEKPETYSNMGDKNFEYNINITGTIVPSDKIVQARRGRNSYKVNKLLGNEILAVSMRAKCKQQYSKNTTWSRWSEPIIYDSRPGSTPLAPHHILLLLGIVTATVLIAIVFLCHRFRIWKKLFPKVPQPAMKYFDQSVQKEFQDQNISMESPPKISDDEECICSAITEISKKDQLEIII